MGIGIGPRSPFGSFGGQVRGADTLLFYENSHYTGRNASDERSISGGLGAAYGADQRPGERNEDQYCSMHIIFHAFLDPQLAPGDSPFQLSTVSAIVPRRRRRGRTPIAGKLATLMMRRRRSCDPEPCIGRTH